MVFSAEDRILIKGLRQEKGYGAKRLISEFPNKPWTLSGLKKLSRKTDTNGTVVLFDIFSVTHLIITVTWLRHLL